MAGYLDDRCSLPGRVVAIVREDSRHNDIARRETLLCWPHVNQISQCLVHMIALEAVKHAACSKFNPNTEVSDMGRPQ
jgi:hypothetical protein